ncbi:MAG: hypothetical protein Q4F84_05550 [Fibrobacter sp.]|nr:hypothetical protein [Fibrobacter sp.]
MKVYRCAQIDETEQLDFFVDCGIDEVKDKRSCPGFLGVIMPPEEDTVCMWKQYGRCHSHIVNLKCANQLKYQLGKKIKELEDEQEED